jgi:hypothetical protein
MRGSCFHSPVSQAPSKSAAGRHRRGDSPGSSSGDHSSDDQGRSDDRDRDRGHAADPRCRDADRRRPRNRDLDLRIKDSVRDHGSVRGESWTASPVLVPAAAVAAAPSVTSQLPSHPSPAAPDDVSTLTCLVVGCHFYRDGRRRMHATSLRIGDCVTLKRSHFAGLPAVSVFSRDGGTRLGSLERDAAHEVDTALAAGKVRTCTVTDILHEVERPRADDGTMFWQSVVTVCVSIVV